MLQLEIMYVGYLVFAVKEDFMNCLNWVSIFSNGIQSCYVTYLSLMQHRYTAFLYNINGFWHHNDGINWWINTSEGLGVKRAAHY